MSAEKPELPGDGHSIGASAKFDVPAAGQPALAETISAIRAWHRERVFAMEIRKRADLALGSFLRSALGWSPALPKSERSRINAQAQSLIALGEAEAKGKPCDTDEPAYAESHDVIVAAIAARAPFDAIEKDATKAMKGLAATLPVWKSFGKDVRGFGVLSLATIVADAGDLGSYPKPGHLWKRLGLAVIGRGDGVADVRQGGLSKSAAKSDWIAHGYSRRRRSRMFVIGDALVKSGAHYRQIYLARKDYERSKALLAGLTIAPAAKIPKASAAAFMSDGHVHRRAQRYMEKRLLKDLWRAWRDGRRATFRVPPDRAKRALPAGQSDERQALRMAPDQAAVKLPVAPPRACVAA